MAENQFVAQLVTDIFDVEVSCLRTDFCIERYVQQYISQLLANIFFVIPHQGITKLVSLFYSVGAQTFIRLLAVPWTFDPKLVEDVQKAAEGFHLFFSCMYHSFDFFINNVAKIMLPCLL